MCPPGSLYGRIVKDWASIRSYVMKGGHLFLSLMADGGIYEFEPARTEQSPAPAPLERVPRVHRNEPESGQNLNPRRGPCHVPGTAESLHRGIGPERAG